MSGRFWAVCVLGSGFALLHCGGTVVTVPAEQGNGGASGHAGAFSRAGSSSVAGHGGQAVARDAGFDEYVDPGCPDAAPPPEKNECDVFATTSTCPPGEGCFPFVDHPFGTGCGVQTFGTACMPTGSGRQGDLCGDDGVQCAAGFLCVVGSQPGKRCVQLCRMTEPSTCPRGLICGELDVEGYGVCS
jgi:hypothetical protein